MLRINFLNTNRNEENYGEKVNDFFAAVEKIENDLKIDILNSKIKSTDKKVAEIKKSKNYTADFKESFLQQLKNDIQNYNKEIDALLRKNEEIAPIYEKVKNAVVGAKNEYTQNTEVAFDNICKLVACGNNTAYFKMIKFDDDTIVKIKKALDAVNAVELPLFNEMGLRRKSARRDEAARAFIQTVKDAVYNAFSLPIENEYTKKIAVNFGKKQFVYLNEIYNIGIDLKSKKIDDNIFFKDAKIQKASASKIQASINKLAIEYIYDKFNEQIKNDKKQEKSKKTK